MPPMPPEALERFFLFRKLRDHASVVSNRPAMDACVLQRAARDLGWIDDTGLDQVFVFAGATS